MKLIIYAIYAMIMNISLARAGLQTKKPAGSGPAPAPGASPTRLLIVGASGGTGLQLVSQALERGHEVTALVRNPAAFKLEHARLTVVKGDVLDYASVEGAARGQDAVLCALGHKKLFYPTRILSEGTRNILRAMESHGVSRFVCETSMGIGHSAWRLGILYTLFIIPVILPFYFWDKTRQEKLIAASNLDWVVVRPGGLNNKEKRGTYRHGPDVGNVIIKVSISRADVADFMLNQLTDNTYLCSAVAVSW